MKTTENILKDTRLIFESIYGESITEKEALEIMNAMIDYLKILKELMEKSNSK